MPTRNKQLCLLALFLVFHGLSGVSHVVVAEELWAIPQAQGKGDDYLLEISPGIEKKNLPRSIRCEKSLPLFVEELQDTAAQLNGVLALRIRGQILKDPDGSERIRNVEMLFVTIAPKSSLFLLPGDKLWNADAKPLQPLPRKADDPPLFPLPLTPTRFSEPAR